MFEYLSKEKGNKRELEILEYWDKIDILNRTIENRKDSKNFVFYDGPAFANGFPGLHHMVAKNLKDAICKYHVMKGERVIRKVGWDTHGLPIENHVEKKLGINSKKEIEELGIEKFNEECRKSVRENEDAFVDLTHKMGQFIDTDNPYLTYKNDYIETEWWILKKFYEKDLFYEGKRIVPYCPHCGTGLATHEVAEGYQTDTAITVYVPFKKKDEDVYFLVWTTTPWTLIANVALCVNPNEDYVLVESKGIKFIMAKPLVETVLGEETNILETYKGKDLEFTEYEQLIPSLTPEGKAFYVTCDEYVTMDSGTGIVHIAPAFGDDDATVCKKYNISELNPVGKDGCYIEGPWIGEFVHDVNEKIVDYLKENDKLFKRQKMAHEYPHCWRCHTPLIYYGMPSYYIKVSEFKDKMVEANKKVNWYPSYVGERRFSNWLENARDWNVSRSRYWGSPIPFWKCECGYNHMVGSVEELKSMATSNIDDNLDLHRPYIDEIKLKCPECGKEMTRILDVLDCWFDSGSMPFAQYHYPFENNELFESQFPADFICEGIDQTRGWFYTLMIISTFVKGCSPFKNVLVNDLLLDAEGKKMSKSRGNIVEPFSTIEEYGSDAVRFYLPYVSPVWTPLKFDMEGLKEVSSKFFSTLKNTYNFFAMYANADKLEVKDFNVTSECYEEIDKWLVSKYNRLVKNVTDSYEEYDLNKVVKFITEFVSEELSNWYIRRNRRRFWKGELDDSKRAVYKVTYDVLVGLSKLIAPISPYISEDIYRNLTNEESVHLTDFPVYNETEINEPVETRMDLVKDLISLGRKGREDANIKIRQPLSRVLLDKKNESIISDLDELIKEELNVKEVIYMEDSSEYLNYEIKPNFKECGRIFGKNINTFAEILKSYSIEDTKNINGKEIEINKDKYTLNEEMLDIRVLSKEGYNTTSDGTNFIIIDTTITEELKNEGILRDLIRFSQVLRKNIGLDISDRIKIEITCSSELKESIIDKYKSEIEQELLGTLTDGLTSEIEEFTDDFGNKFNIKIEKAN